MKSMRRIFLILSLLLPVTVLVSSASLAETKLEATIFSYDGKDFVRTETTLMKEGQSAANTKLDPDSAAYKALVEKHSYTGPATVFGRPRPCRPRYHGQVVCWPRIVHLSSRSFPPSGAGLYQSGSKPQRSGLSVRLDFQKA